MRKITLLFSLILSVAFTQAQTTVYSETFGESQGDFTIYDVTLPDGGTYVWKWDSYKYMKASAYISSAKASESWLISPAINLSNTTVATLTFDHTGKFFTADKLTEQALLVSTNYTEGNPSTATWTPLVIPTWPTGNDWTVVSSGDIDLSTITNNDNVHFAFKYVSTTNGAATWEIKNFLITTPTTGLHNTSSNKFKAFVSGESLMFQNAVNGSSVEIYSALGSKVMTSTIESGKVSISNLSKGLYIVRVGKDTQKIML